MPKTTFLESLHLSDWGYPEKMEEPHPLNFLVTDDSDIVTLKKAYVRELGKPDKLFVDIEGKIQRRIDVSYLSGLNTGLHKGTLFPYKNGFGLINHDKPELHLWADLAGDSEIIEIENGSKDIEVFDNCMRFASYDSAEDRFVIGIGAKHSPRTYAKWWATLDVERGKGIWKQVQALSLEDYPKTFLHYRSPVLEWLNIIELMAHGGKKYLVTHGGQHTVGRSGREFEFYVLGIYDRDDRLEKTIEMDFGKGHFSTDKKHFSLRPKTKKRLLIYDLHKQELECNIPLKPATNLGKISRDKLRYADLKEDLLYLTDFTSLSICKLEK